MFLRQTENELFKTAETPLVYSNLSKKEREAVKTSADKGSCIVIWDRNDYVTERERQLKNELVYKKLLS